MSTGDRGRRATDGKQIDPAVYDELPDGVLVADAHGMVVALNRAGARLLGRPREDCLGHDYRAVLPLTDDAGRDWWACTRPYDGLASRSRQPERLLTLSGTAGDRELLVTAGYVREPRSDGRPGPLSRLVVAFRDTAARQRQERAAADLVSTVAHELRSPLTSVKGFTATLLAKWDRFPDEQKKLMLATVNADADRVTRLLAELLDVSRIQAGRIELRRQVVDLAQSVHRAVAGRVAAGERADRFMVEARGELPEMWLDPDKIAQIIGNLLENGVRHGAGRVTVVLEPSDEGPVGGAAVTVTDEGEGIPAETLSRVFMKFFRGNRRGGTGLGLFIVKGLVEAHGGTIEAGRGPAGGAQFRFVLPAGAPSYLV